MFYIAALALLFASRSLTSRLVGVSALTLDTRTSRLWEENSGMIHEIAQQRLCRDGTSPKLERIELDGELTTYKLQCEESSWRNASMDVGELYKRQSTALCTTSCSQNCYHPADYNPDPKDCGNITSILRSRNSNWDVSVGGTNVVQWRTCIYTFSNQAHNTINFCDSAWASIGDSIAWTCGRWLSDPAKGGICSNSNFFVTAVRTPNMPGPSYTVSFSTAGYTELNPSSEPPSSSSSSVSSSSQSSGSILSTGGTSGNTVSGLSTISQSTVSYETLNDLPGGVVGASTTAHEGSSSPTSGSAQSNDTKKTDTPAIIGGTIAAIAAIALLLAVFFIIRRAKRYREIRSQRGQSYPPSSDITFSRPTSYGANPDPFRIPNGSVVKMGIGAHGEKAMMSRDFGSTSTSYATSQRTLSTRREQRSPRSDVLQLTERDPPGPHHQSPEDTLPPPAPTVEALIAAAAPLEMSRQQIDLLAANFVSLVRGRQPLGEEPQEDEEDGSEARQPPPYQQQ